MKYNPNRLRKKSEEIVDAQRWACTIVTSVIGLNLFTSEFQRIQKLEFNIINYVYLALFILTGILIFLWYWSTKKEIDLILKWADPLKYTPPSTIKEIGMILSIGILLVSLFYTACNPLLYGIIFLVYSIFVLFAVKYSNIVLKKVFECSRDRIKSDLKLIKNKEVKHEYILYLKGVKILEEYFIKKPHTKRHFIIIVFIALGVFFSLMWNIYANKFCGIIAYILYIIVVLVSEIIIGIWRIMRDKKLNPIISKLSEIIKNDE